MIWQNPWAFAGVVAIVIPIVIHLLSRRTARSERFPTLRFLPTSQSAPVRFTRITDPVLLLMRVSIIALAVAALAQPLVRSDARTAAAEGHVVRAIVVDTSVSMRRHGQNGAPTVDSARRVSASLSESAAMAMVVETADPARAIQGAAAWVRTQHGRREVIIVSDFQIGTIDSIDLRSIGDGVSVGLVQVSGAGATSAVAVPSPVSGTVTLLVAPEHRAAAEAARIAAAPVPFDTSIAVAIAYAGAPDRERLQREARPIANPGHADIFLRLDRDPLLRAALEVTTSTDAAPSDGERPALRGVGGNSAVVHAARAEVSGRETLVLFPSFPPDELASVVLIAAVARAVAPPPSPLELEPERIPAETLRQWERRSDVGLKLPAQATGESDGKWLWLAVLVMLGAEALVRRRKGDSGNAVAAHVV